MELEAIFKWAGMAMILVMGTVLIDSYITENTKVKLGQASAICLSYDSNDWDTEKNVCKAK